MIRARRPIDLGMGLHAEGIHRRHRNWRRPLARRRYTGELHWRTVTSWHIADAPTPYHSDRQARAELGLGAPGSGGPLV